VRLGSRITEVIFPGTADCSTTWGQLEAARPAHGAWAPDCERHEALPESGVRKGHPGFTLPPRSVCLTIAASPCPYAGIRARDPAGAATEPWLAVRYRRVTGGGCREPGSLRAGAPTQDEYAHGGDVPWVLFTPPEQHSAPLSTASTSSQHPAGKIPGGWKGVPFRALERRESASRT